MSKKQKSDFRKLSLRPYPGEVWIFRSLKELRATYKRLIGSEYPYQDEKTGGRYIVAQRGDLASGRVFLVYGRSPAVLAHELSHVLLMLFTDIGCDPAAGNGEPFCYMLSQLMIECEI